MRFAQREVEEHVLLVAHVDCYDHWNGFSKFKVYKNLKVQFYGKQ